MQSVHLWLRDETKPQERRTALSPKHVKDLQRHGFQVTVESSEVRCYPDQEYMASGAKLVASGSWRKAPQDAFILGLKELPEDSSPLVHRHIYFAHCFKGQKGWQNTVSRFKEGGGFLLDLEFLVDDNGRRVAAFGKWAGYAGAAIAVDMWSHQILSPGSVYPSVKLFNHKQELVDYLDSSYEKAVRKAGFLPKVLVMGAKGRCGGGAHALLKDLRFATDQVTLWDKEETASGGPFPEILQQNIFVNCVLLQGDMKPFLNKEMISGYRALSVISDVSCDPTSPNNPLPIYESTTTFQKPTVNLVSNPVLDLTAIDHLPSLLPRESSEDFADQLLPHLKNLTTGSSVWERAAVLFRKFEEQI